MRYIKFFEDFNYIVDDDSEATLKRAFARPKDVNLDFDLEYIKYAKRLAKVKKSDPKYTLQVKAKDVMSEGIISIPKGIFIVLNDFKFGKSLFKKDSIIDSDGVGNLTITNTDGTTETKKAKGPKRGFERFYLNFYANTKRKEEDKISPFTRKEKDLINFIYSNKNKASKEEITNFLQGFATTAETELEPRKLKIYRDAFIYEINKKFRESGLGTDNFILLPTGMKGSLKGQAKEFDYKINPDYLNIIKTLI